MRKIVEIASRIYISLAFLMFILDAERVSLTLANLPLACVVVLALLLSLAESDLIIGTVRVFKTTWRQWSDRRHFLTVGAVFLLLVALNLKFIFMMREFGTRIGQQ